MDVGIRELKANLSAYLERAARGEVIRVTERGRPKAILAPLPGRVRIEQGIAEGWIRAPKLASRAAVRQRFRASTTIQQIMDEDRGR